MKTRVFLIAVHFLLIVQMLNAQQIIYVTENGSGNLSGDSWANAKAGTTLQSAIDGLESSGGEVWVAEGTYYPQEITFDNKISFRMRAQVELYGGFSPNNNAATKESRDPITYRTILSGDIGKDDSEIINPANPQANRSDNAKHVVVCSEENASAILDGFTIEGGCAIYGNKLDWTSNCGGGLYIESATTGSMGPTVRNCTFRKNVAVWGGGLYTRAMCRKDVDNPATFNFHNNIFENNCADLGAGMCFLGWKSWSGSDEAYAKPVITQNTFVDNVANFHGGGLFIGGRVSFLFGSPDLSEDQSAMDATIEGNTFLFNTAKLYGGAFLMTGCSPEPSSLLATSNYILGNSATMGGGCYLYAAWKLQSVDFQFYNNVVANNSAINGKGGGFFIEEVYQDCGLRATIVNNTIVNNAANNEEGITHVYGDINLHNNIMWDSGRGGSNLNAENAASDGPRFENPSTFVGIASGYTERAEIKTADWALLPNSHLNNKGESSYFPSSITTDILGNPRIVGNNIDLGAFETENPSVPTSVSLVGLDEIAIFPTAVSETLSVQNAPTGSLVSIYSITGKLYKQVAPQSEISVEKLPEGIYFVKLTHNRMQLVCQRIVIQKRN